MVNTVAPNSAHEYTRTLDIVTKHESRSQRDTRPDQQSRAERKEQTRQDLLDATLGLAADKSFAALSLREVARAAGIVPTAFYRHFESMDELGVAVVESAMTPLRRMIREVRGGRVGESAITVSIEALANSVRQNEADFRFLLRETNGGVAAVVRAISVELHQITQELVIDLARVPALHSWSAADLEMAADLIVSSMTRVVQQLLDLREAGPDAERAALKRAEQQLRLIVLGMANWQPH